MNPWNGEPLGEVVMSSSLYANPDMVRDLSSAIRDFASLRIAVAIGSVTPVGEPGNR